MWKILLFFLANLTTILAGYYCNTPTHCTLYCNNINDFSQLNKTHWIIVPRQDDSCYFYNTLTGISIEPHN